MKLITYTSETDIEYRDEISNAKSLPDLLGVILSYGSLVDDALDAIPKNEEEFKWFRKGLAKERRGKFAGEDWATRFSAIILPEKMTRISLIADQFRVPFGTAYLRITDIGLE